MQRDIWKEAFREALPSEPEHSPADAGMWETLLDQIESRVDRKEKHSTWLWVAAAGVVMVIGTCWKIHQTNSLYENPRISLQAFGTTPPVLEEKTHSVSSKGQPEKEYSVDAHPKTTIKTTDAISQHLLPDGSRLYMNRSSEASIAPDFVKERKLSLKGEAFLSIAPDKSRPFTIFCGETKLIVTGTRLNIRQDVDDLSEITVTEGSVMVFLKDGKNRIELGKGQQLKIANKKVDITTKENPDIVTYWIKEDLVFNNTLLEDIATVLSRKFNRPILVSPHIRRCSFSGDVTGLTLDEALNVLKLALDVQMRDDGVSTYIAGTKCP